MTARTGFSPVHPHACGENAVWIARRAAWLGSPPRVWGKPRLVPGQLRLIRFTPTRVGKTSSTPPERRYPQVHPHACGENAIMKTAKSTADGSPPRVWGKRRPAHHRNRRHRFTPTRVGKTRSRARLRAWRPVHPHACGENGAQMVQKICALGSPPRVWGKRRSATRPMWWMPVHPHACGENESG